MYTASALKKNNDNQNYVRKWRLLTLLLPNVAKGKFRPKFQISVSKVLTNKYHHVKVQTESFHLNGHIIGFRPQTQMVESRYKTPSSTLAVKGLKKWRMEIRSIVEPPVSDHSKFEDLVLAYER